jgi:hypothetical protein
MSRASKHRLGPILVALTLMGCSTARSTPDGEWRRARVLQLVHGADLTDGKHDPCVASLAAAQIAGHEFVVVRYAQGRWARYRTLPVSPAVNASVGQTLWFNLRSCELAQTEPPA